MRRLHVFDAVADDFGGPVVHLYVSFSSAVEIDGATIDRCLSPELRSVEEIDAYGRLLQADLAATIEKAKRIFRNLERRPRVPLF